MVKAGLLILSVCAVCVLSAYPGTVSAAVRVVMPGKITKDGHIQMNETFRLHFEYDGKLSGEPDWSPIRKHFHIHSSSVQHNVKIVNGQKNEMTAWGLDLTPKRAGVLEVPPVRFGNQMSPRQRIRVAAAKKTKVEDFYIEVRAEPPQVYVQQEVLVRVKVFMAHALGGSVTPFQIKGGQAIIKKLQQEKRYRQKLNGKQYEVYELSYLLYPQVSGKLTLEGMELKGQYSRGRQRMRVNKRAQRLDIAVLPVPDQYRRSEWLPAKRVLLNESWEGDIQSLRVGVPFTRRVTLQAEGVLSEQLPTPDLSVGEGFKAYKNAPEKNSRMEGERMHAVSRTEIVLIPKTAGEAVLPALRLPWWNTATKREEWVTLAARTLDVQDAPETALVTLEEPVSFEAVRADDGGKASSYWMWASFFLMTLWAATMTAWVAKWPVPLPRRAQTAGVRTNESAVAAKRHLKKSCESGDASQARNALIAWAQAHGMPDATLTNIALRYGGDLAGQIGVLNRCLYAPAAMARPRPDGGGDEEKETDAIDSPRPERPAGSADSEWDGMALWQAFKQVMESETGATDGMPEGGEGRGAVFRVLRPLYPTRG